jgi:TIR domain
MPVFISYSQKDDAIYKTFCISLEGQNINHWSSQNMFAGQSLREQLRLAVNDSEICVFLATKNSIKSEWCSAELGAFWGKGIKVIVYIIDSDLRDDIIPVQFQGDLWTRDPRDVIRAINAEMKSASESRNVDFGIKILNPIKDEKVRNPVDLSGTFKINPPSSYAVAVWECHPRMRLYWPKKYILFDNFSNKWSVRLHIGGNPHSERELIVVTMGANGKALFDYSRKVFETNRANPNYSWPGIEFLPHDVLFCHSVTVFNSDASDKS